jgi:hypothetical protein
MLTNAPEVLVRLATEIRVNLLTGDLTAGAGPLGRMLLAGLGALRSVSRADDDDSVLLETMSGERWLIRISPVSGLVMAVEPVPDIRTGRRRATDAPP